MPGHVLLHAAGGRRCRTGRPASGSAATVTLEGLLGAVYDGLQLATMLACVGAANALANPKRLLRAVPGALYEVGVAVVVALTFAPQLVEGVSRVRAARRLRGRARHAGCAGCAASRCRCSRARSSARVELAAAMDSRGYGRGAADAAARAGAPAR